MPGEGNQKKRHHYVPVAYLNRFADADGKIFAYRKDGPRTLHLRPAEIAFERYYYSQPLPDGGRDNNTLEDLFCEVETQWPAVVDALAARQDVRQRGEALFSFVSLLRVRGPAARDPVELFLAHQMRRKMHRMAEAGKLSPLPHNLTLNDIEVAIDPHQSLHAMFDMLKGLAPIWERVGVEVVHNTTAEAFATSDNPVVYFDPDVPEAQLQPYAVRPNRRIEMLVPITPTVMLRGRTELPIHRRGGTLRHVEMSTPAEVRRVNRLVARFGYRFVFANHGGLETLVAKHAALSPTIQFDDVRDSNGSEVNFSQMVFGPRPTKPKFEPR